MSTMKLRELDLNLLLVFQQLLLDRSVSVAAERLGLTQPAISNALKRLRAVLQDELFLRTSRGMEPTPYALHLAEPVGYALGTLQNALAHRNGFDPLASERCFRLALTDIGEIYFLPPLMDALAQRAPRVRIETRRPDAGELKEDMAAGQVDLAIGLLPDLQSGFFQRRLFHHSYVCLFRRGHPLARPPLSLQQFCELEHVEVRPANTGHSEVAGLIERSGIKPRMRLSVPHFIAVGPILQSTDLVATVPQRFAERVEQAFGLQSSPHPVPLPEIAINLFWHARYHRDPASLWLRQLLVELFADSPSGG